MFARLTTEERMFLRDEINRKIVEQHERSIAEPSEEEKNDAEKQIQRLRERWGRISKFGGIVPREHLLDEITRTVRKFVVVNKDEAQVTALWTVHTHPMRYEVFDYTPRLLPWSKQPGCGKTTFRNVLSQIVSNPISSEGITGNDLLALLKEHNGPPPVLAGHGNLSDRRTAKSPRF